jgi:hypothetical protein
MPLKPAARAWIAKLLLAVLGFSHLAVALAACPMERGTMAAVVAPAMAEPCAEDGMFMSSFGPQYVNRCVAHCTSDLQNVGALIPLVASGAGVPVLMVPQVRWAAARHTGLEFPPPGTPPPRILQHSFLV